MPKRFVLFVVAAVLAAAAPGLARAARLADLPGAWPAGTIVISDAKRELFLSLGGGKAIEYPVAVPKWDKKWFGETRIVGKYVRPAWSPPASVKVDHPELPDVIPGGSPHNPMGARAMMLAKSEIAIHGTNAWMRKSVGTAASYGCIRMRNEDVTDLFARVSVGTPVVMVR